MTQIVGYTPQSAYVTLVIAAQQITLPFATLTRVEERPEYAEDDRAQVYRHLTVEGHCVLADDADVAAVLDLVNENSGVVDSWTVVVSNSNISELTSTNDAKRTPKVSISVTQVTGKRVAMATFTLEGFIGRGASDYPVLTHRWVQSFALDASGHLTRTVRGSIMVDLAATGATLTVAPNGTVGNVSNRAPYADLLRYAILPNVPDDGTVWRRESQTYAYNEQGTGLVYEITDVQGRVDVPDGAYTGTANFTYERSLANLGYAVVRFDCELEGPPNGDVRRLIWGAVSLAQSRLPIRQVFVQRMMVQEMEMLRKAKIRFEMEAWAMCTEAENGAANSTVAAVPLAAYVGKNFTVTRTCDAIMPPYGGSGIGYYGIPHWKDNLTSAKLVTPQNLKVASMTKVVEPGESCTPGNPAIVFVTTDVGLTVINSALVQGPFANTQQVTGGTDGEPQTTAASSAHTHVHTKTRMHRLQTLYTEGSDFVFQVGKPIVVVTERSESKRLNVPPARTFRPIPAGFVVVEDDWKVNFGTVDQSGNRAFTGMYTRVLEAYDTGGPISNGYYTQTGVRHWWAPGNVVNTPLARGYSNSTQSVSNSVFPSGGTTQTYDVGTPQNYS